MWDENFVNAKYHLAVAERMLVMYGEYPEKRVLIGVIREAAEAVSFLIKFVGKDWRGVFSSRVGGVTCENLFRILEVARAQRDSPVEYARGDKIILLINGKYRILTVDRIREFVGAVGVAIGKFSGKFRQV